MGGTADDDDEEEYIACEEGVEYAFVLGVRVVVVVDIDDLLTRRLLVLAACAAIVKEVGALAFLRGRN